MKRTFLNKILRNWILALACCTLAAIVFDMVFSVFDSRESISSEVERNNPEADVKPEKIVHKSAFDSVRSEHLKSKGINPDSIMNL